MYNDKYQNLELQLKGNCRPNSD